MSSPVPQTEEIVLLTLLGIPPGCLTSIPHAAGDGDRKLTAEEEEAQRIAEMGKPVLGENCRLEVIIEESYDFKVTFRVLPFREACPELGWAGRGGSGTQGKSQSWGARWGPWVVSGPASAPWKAHDSLPGQGM